MRNLKQSELYVQGKGKIYLSPVLRHLILSLVDLSFQCCFRAAERMIEELSKPKDGAHPIVYEKQFAVVSLWDLSQNQNRSLQNRTRWMCE